MAALSSRRNPPRRPPQAPKPRASTDLSRFEPYSPLARRQVDFLLARGARLLEVSASQVVLVRDGHTARVDAMGRVEWQTKP